MHFINIVLHKVIDTFFDTFMSFVGAFNQSQGHCKLKINLDQEKKRFVIVPLWI
jgi:hypothetical protein